jgi:hypothetical protein
MSERDLDVQGYDQHTDRNSTASSIMLFGVFWVSRIVFSPSIKDHNANARVSKTGLHISEYPNMKTVKQC